MTALNELTIAAARDVLAKGETSATDPTMACLTAIDAGDAGIRVRGKFLGGAKFYYNDNNIRADGGITEGPTAAPAVTPVAAVTSPTNSESRALEDAPPAAGKRGGGDGMLTVEVLDNDPPPSNTPPGGKNDDERKEHRRSSG